MSEQKGKTNNPQTKALLDFADQDDICPPWWPRLLWRLHFPLGGGTSPWPNPVNYPPIIDHIMAGLHIHTMSYLMPNQKAAQEIRDIAEKQLGEDVRNLSKAHEENVGKRKAA